jgi:hypothetical protein
LVHRWIDQSELAPKMGIVIAAYFSAQPSDEMVRQLLWMTLGDTPHYLPLDQVCVVVDGDERTARIAGQIRDRFQKAEGISFELLSLPENRGKLWAVREGMCCLLQHHTQIEYLVTRDGDGDHALSAVPQLARTAAFLHETYQHLNLIVLGARPSRHRPMGWIRGELETLLDQLTLDALAYAMAGQGRVLNLSHCAGGSVPDISSGFKVYGRKSAEELFCHGAPHMRTLSPSDYWHFGPETVAVVEGLLDGAVLAETLRLTWDGQPTSSFADFRHQALYGELLTWVFARLDIPVAIAAQLYDNRSLSLDLATEGQGRETLESLRDLVLMRLAGYRQEPCARPARPRLPFL